MFKTICFRIMIPLILFGLLLGPGDAPVLAADVKLSKDSTLEGIIKRGVLRIGVDAGYMPFEMIDKRSGLRQKEIRHGGVRHKGDRKSVV